MKLCLSPEISNERLKSALRTAAELVELYGDDYLPIFEHLETEWTARQKNTNTKDRIKLLLSEPIATSQ